MSNGGAGTATAAGGDNADVPETSVAANGNADGNDNSEQNGSTDNTPVEWDPGSRGTPRAVGQPSSADQAGVLLRKYNTSVKAMRLAGSLFMTRILGMRPAGRPVGAGRGEGRVLCGAQ